MCLAVPVKVIDIPTSKTAQVEINGVKLEVSSLLIKDLKVGDYVLIHAGFIIEKLTTEDAEEKMALFAEYMQKMP